MEKQVKIYIALSLCPLIFNSCSKDGTEFQKIDLPQSSSPLSTSPDLTSDNPDGDDSSGTNTDISPDVIEPEVDKVEASCLQAENDDSMQTFSTYVFFDSTYGCEFNEEGVDAYDLNELGNGPRKDRKIRARIEQKNIVRLPSSGKICDVDFSFAKQAMEYDDEIFLLLNNFVLMSSSNYGTDSGNPHYENGLAVNSSGLQTYKWLGENSLYNLHYGQRATPRYCYGTNPSSPIYDMQCAIPETEVLGQIKLDIPKDKIIELGVISDLINNNENGLRELNFGFVSIGDNDNGDCEHSDFGFDLRVKYYISN